MTQIFIGRTWELDQLRTLSQYKIARFVVIKGRRRIGKSRLVKEFAQQSSRATKEAVKFVSLSGLPPTSALTAQDQRDDFARQLSRIFQTSIPSSQDWGDLFWSLSHHTQQGKTIILLDEISWMGMKDPTFLGKLKTAWDLQFKNNSDLTLILCGSVSSWIEKNILKNTGFVGRIDLTLTLDELSLGESLMLLGKQAQGLSSMEIFKILSVTGGIPRYLEIILPQFSAEDNMKRLCFTRGGFFFQEFDQLFHDLFSSRNQTYIKILNALIQTPHAYLNQMIDAMEIEKSGTISDYLFDLSQAGFITRYHTWDLKQSKTSKLGSYRISDNYVRFFLKYIRPLQFQIEKGDFQDRSLSTLPGWETIMGLQFENLVLKNRRSLLNLLHINPGEIRHDGPYFQKKTSKHPGCQIDYLIQTRFNTLYICEIKFSRHPISPQVVKEVQEKIKALDIPRNTSVRPVLIHMNGVEDNLIGEEFFAHILDFSDFLKPF
jgi:AAA+ ATPase superfamily predicted ATPase